MLARILGVYGTIHDRRQSRVVQRGQQGQQGVVLTCRLPIHGYHDLQLLLL